MKKNRLYLLSLFLFLCILIVIQISTTTTNSNHPKEYNNENNNKKNLTLQENNELSSKNFEFSVQGNWYSLSSYMRIKLIDLYNNLSTIDSQTNKVITILNEEKLYKDINTKTIEGANLSPQKLLYKEVSNGYYKVNTWLGERWIYPEEYLDSKNVRMLRTKRTLNLYKINSFSSEKLGTVAPQTVTVKEKKENWYLISTYLGLRWINPIDDKNDINTKGKVAYITFDDGPTKNTSKLLDILKTKSAKATFFMIEPNMRSYPNEVLRMAQEGHYLGSHSVTHDKDRLYLGKSPSVTNEMNKTKQTISSLSGQTNNLIRVPYGSKPYLKDHLRNSLVSNGFKMWDWTLDTNDWRYTSNPSKILDEIKNQLPSLERNKTPIVILMHDKATTVQVLPQVIDYLHSKGYNLIAYNPSDHFMVNFWDDSRL